MIEVAFIILINCFECLLKIYVRISQKGLSYILSFSLTFKQFLPQFKVSQPCAVTEDFFVFVFEVKIPWSSLSNCVEIETTFWGDCHAEVLVPEFISLRMICVLLNEGNEILFCNSQSSSCCRMLRNISLQRSHKIIQVDIILTSFIEKSEGIISIEIL
jgi:hypothetical protein